MGKSILVIDDSMINRRVAETKLTSANFQVETAGDGVEALKILKVEEQPDSPGFDAVLLDVMMPGIDGLEVLKRIREVWNEVQLPVIMVTSKDKSEDITGALNLGANDYVTKPLDLGILLARLETHLKLSEYHDSLMRAQNSLLSAARIETVGLLAAGVAHEIRNPLGRIQMAVGALQGVMENLPEEHRDTASMLLETAIDSVGAADSIVEGLMKSFGSEKLDLHEVEINDVLQRSIDYLRPEIESSGATLKLDLNRNPPPVSMAEEEFQQALVAIMRNAIQAMKIAGSSPADLIIRTRVGEMSGVAVSDGARSGNRLRNGDEVLIISLEDSGPGMTRVQREAAFDAFFTTKATGAGTGLGLTVARKIVDLHKGVIRLEDREEGVSGLKVSIFLKILSKNVRFV